MVFKCSAPGVHLEAAQKEKQGPRCLLGAGSGLASPARPGTGFTALALHSLQCKVGSDAAWGSLYFSWERTFVPLSRVALSWKSSRQEGADLFAIVGQPRQNRWPVCAAAFAACLPLAILGSVTPSGARLEPLSWPPSCGAWTLQACCPVPPEVLLQIWWGSSLVGVELLRVALATGASAERLWLV